jgi:hypothetical protein
MAYGYFHHSWRKWFDPSRVYIVVMVKVKSANWQSSYFGTSPEIGAGEANP